jgi:hypothetical protein
MTEAILTRKKVEELPGVNTFSFYTLLHAELPWLPKDLFMSDRPCNARYR